MSPSLFSVRFLTLVVAAAGLAWGLVTLPGSEASDDLLDVESQLLRSETFTPKALARTLKTPAFEKLSNCDVPAQIALLLIEARVSEATLRAGAVNDFDLHSASIDSRSDRVLACAPRQSFVWLMKFSQAILRGQLDERSFAFLAMSYETSPDEGWVTIRRNNVAVPLLLVFPEPLKEKALSDFQRLVKGGFNEEAGRLYQGASPPIRSLLQASVEQLESYRQKSFWDAVHRVGS